MIALVVAVLCGIGGISKFASEGAEEPVGNSSPAWMSGGLTYTLVDSSNAMPCSAHAYGAVLDFLASQPCNALNRALFEASDDGGHQMLVAVSWTDMPTVETAVQLQQKIDRSGNGNITELSKESNKYPGVPFTGKHYASTVNDRTTVVAQAEPLLKAPSADLLKNTAKLALSAARP
ncbi:hypothetical protein [Amycolatopsis sp. lyj-90]|uniref:hypothetical protein n=1 Tax=Amycolatopsis sp. lyj-90 TaxID=2789285 RepID=UPI00397955F2